jgi:hypothetical protein
MGPIDVVVLELANRRNLSGVRRLGMWCGVLKGAGIKFFVVIPPEVRNEWQILTLHGMSKKKPFFPSIADALSSLENCDDLGSDAK